jgi:hypothetical protein
MVTLAIMYIILYVHSYFKLHGLSMAAIDAFRAFLMVQGLSLISKHPVPHTENNADPYQTLRAMVDIRVSILRQATEKRLVISNLWMTPLVLLYTVLDDETFSDTYQEELVRGYREELSLHDPFLKAIVEHEPDD